MRTKFWRCPQCRRYTLEHTCPRCQAETRNPIPPRFSPHDPFGRYRRMAKQTPGEEQAK
ncbi:MAG: RNA-protein complex protein Nop10 [Euryarchaeota archaeon]|nr:RNA-protein complex protein Nop10 [Euryarchaeota archaeon]